MPLSSSIARSARMQHAAWLRSGATPRKPRAASPRCTSPFAGPSGKQTAGVVRAFAPSGEGCAGLNRHSSGKNLIEEMTAGAVLDFEDPCIWIEAQFACEAFLDLGFRDGLFTDAAAEQPVRRTRMLEHALRRRAAPAVLPSRRSVRSGRPPRAR